MNKSDYRLEADGRFVIRDYNNQKPFSNFLPGIAGLHGIPMWAFYVNRGQGIASFGTRNKDGAILEFFPANKAYQMTPSMGFRTFIKYRVLDSSKAAVLFHEPFFPRASADGGQNQVLEVSSHEFSVSDFDPSSGLRSSAVYFTLPEEPLAALVREFTLTNESRKTLEIDLLDGLPSVTPYGMNEFLVKHMSRTIEAWMTTENFEKKAPFFRLRVDATDRPEVEVIREGNFYFSLLEAKGSAIELLEPVVDPAKVFGERLDFSSPVVFRGHAFRESLAGQVTENKTPCAFSAASFALSPGASVKIRSYFGQARDLETLGHLVARAKKAGFGEAKRRQNDEMIRRIKSGIFTVTASSAYDLYCGQTYLDNMLRGGMPVCLWEGRKPLVYYVYSRKHGDLERDYNQFLVEPAYFAQGNGNYRDVNQNRRSDVWFWPFVGDTNIRTFLNLIQLDGFNPLVVRGDDFCLTRRPQEALKTIQNFCGLKNADAVFQYLKKPFKLGDLLAYLEGHSYLTAAVFSDFLKAMLPFLSAQARADHGEGFWVDHWMYGLDLIEGYLSLYPENAARLLWGDKDYMFYDSDHTVRARSEKYSLNTSGQVRQFKSVVRDEEKSLLIGSRAQQASWVRTRYGKGEIYHTTLWVKLLCLFANKLSSLDAQGTGIEMEADKPSWYDALNGLPGLLGSSLPETFELKRLAVFLIQRMDELALPAKSTVAAPEELYDFILGLDRLLEKNFRQKTRGKDFEFWDHATSLRENYRARTRLGVSGRQKNITFTKIRLFLEHGREKIQVGIEKSFDPKSGLYPTYFENEVTKFKTVKTKEKTRVVPRSFSQKPLPFFLEGPVHALKVEKDAEKRRALVRAVRESALYDKKLGMYRVNTGLEGASLEVGRARVFKRGWLENESVWLHMEYKWLLEMLKSGMTEEFFSDFKKALVPFQPAERYGRSVLENSSFIVSSAFSDTSLHGAGFVARLSGSTAEFLNIWLLMNVGKRPFSFNQGKKLELRFEPCLPSFLFLNQAVSRVYFAPDGKETQAHVPKNALAFLFLGKTLVVYHNPKRMDTFGKNRVWPKKIKLSDKKAKLAEFEGGIIPDPWARRVRDEKISRIDIELG